jgi:hypothetical protein
MNHSPKDTEQPWITDANSYDQDGSIQNKDKQKGVIKFDKD